MSQARSSSVAVYVNLDGKDRARRNQSTTVNRLSFRRFGGTVAKVLRPIRLTGLSNLALVACEAVALLRCWSRSLQRAIGHQRTHGSDSRNEPDQSALLHRIKPFLPGTKCCFLDSNTNVQSVLMKSVTNRDSFTSISSNVAIGWLYTGLYTV